MDSQSELHLEIKRQALEFLDSDHGHGEYALRIGALMAEDKKCFRLNVDLAYLRGFEQGVLHDRIMETPGEVVPAFEEALEETIRNRDPKWLPEGQKMHVGIMGEFGANQVSPRHLMAHLMSKLVSVRGIVTKASLIRPKMVKSVHYCEATGQTLTRVYRDVTSHDGAPTGSAYPTKDENGDLLSTEYGLCQYRDSQMVTVQELPETAPPGQLPRSVDLILEDDLADCVKPGDRVDVVGIYKAIAPNAKGSISGFFKALVCGLSVKKLSRAIENHNLSKTDLSNIKNMARKKDLLELLGTSMAPSIHGHDVPKQALVLLLLGGVEKNLANGAHLRGDINCLFVGDPGVAKSQMLRAVMNVASLSVNTTGRGSSGVGLTAAVTVDKDTGEKRLEAGAMVLADRGVVCIDEFDKMSDLDRVAIHEVMEQQTVTIAKAGIHTTLNARCSVVAAANPLYGSYEASMSKDKNINLPDSLLSRFDLIFVMLDDLNHDQAISSHVLGQHRYRAPGDDQGMLVEQNVHDMLGLEDDEEGDQTSAMHVKYDRLLHGAKQRGKKTMLPVSHGFLKKYIHFAKTRIRPELTPEASEDIAAYYTDLRQFQASPRVTVRMLETIIRLSTAHAKLRLSNTVERTDVDAIKKILEVCTGYSADEGQVKDTGSYEKSIEASRMDLQEKEKGSLGRKGAKRVKPDDPDHDEAGDDSDSDEGEDEGMTQDDSDDDDTPAGGRGSQASGARRSSRGRGSPSTSQGDETMLETEDALDDDRQTTTATLASMYNAAPPEITNAIKKFLQTSSEAENGVAMNHLRRILQDSDPSLKHLTMAEVQAASQEICHADPTFMWVKDAVDYPDGAIFLV